MQKLYTNTLTIYDLGNKLTILFRYLKWDERICVSACVREGQRQQPQQRLNKELSYEKKNPSQESWREQ